VRRALVVVGVVVVALGAVGTVAASAAPKSPGLLQASDLPGGLQPNGTPGAYPNPAVLAVTAATCTETTQVDPSALGGVQLTFARPAAASSTVTLGENVVVYPTAKAAATAFAQRARFHAARLKCGTLGFVRPGGTAVTGTTSYQGGKFPKIGGGSYLESSGTPGTVNTNTNVTFVSGPYLVGLTTFGGTSPVTVAEFRSIAPRALKRLPVSTPIPTTSTAPH
jgi:hypothetical protein